MADPQSMLISLSLFSPTLSWSTFCFIPLRTYLFLSLTTLLSAIPLNLPRGSKGSPGALVAASEGNVVSLSPLWGSTEGVGTSRLLPEHQPCVVSGPTELKQMPSHLVGMPKGNDFTSGVT